MSKAPRALNCAINRALRFNRDVRSISNRHAQYESCKAAWIQQNPDATPAQYDTAMNRIARECKV